MTEEIERLSHLARVRLVVPERRELLVAKLGTRYKLDMKDESIFIWDAEISNDQLDSHFTHMNEKTLNNYAADSATGVAFLKGHDWHSLPMGYSFASEVEDEGSRKRTIASFYTIRSLDGAQDLITRMETGILRDVSVGFHGGTMNCDICHQDFWDCRHFPGIKYEEKVDDVVRVVVATYEIDDANLSEVSGVFDGSTPDAMILKAQRAAKAGILSVQEARVLENQYRISLPLSRSFAVAPTKEKKTVTEEQEKKLREVVISSGIVPEDKREALDVDGTLVYINDLVLRNVALTQEAEMGRQYRTSLVEEAVTQGVRAQGNDFDVESYRKSLLTLPLDMVKRMSADWKKLADASLPSGQTTSAKTEDARTVEVRSHIPDAAYT